MSEDFDKSAPIVSDTVAFEKYSGSEAPAKAYIDVTCKGLDITGDKPIVAWGTENGTYDHAGTYNSATSITLKDVPVNTGTVYVQVTDAGISASEKKFKATVNITWAVIEDLYDLRPLYEKALPELCSDKKVKEEIDNKAKEELDKRLKKKSKDLEKKNFEKEKIKEELEKEKKKFEEVNWKVIVPFVAQVGKKYRDYIDNGYRKKDGTKTKPHILFVGKATNGWQGSVNYDESDEEIKDYLDAAFALSDSDGKNQGADKEEVPEEKPVLETETVSVKVSGENIAKESVRIKGTAIEKGKSFTVETAPKEILDATDVSIKVSYDGSNYTVDGSFKIPKNKDISETAELKWESPKGVSTDNKDVTKLTLTGKYENGTFTVSGGLYTGYGILVHRADEMRWVENQWGTNDEEEYDSSESDFWKLVKDITIHFFGGKNWTSNIAYSNLYKFACVKELGGMPTGTMIKIQEPYTFQILDEEIDNYFKPDVVVFFTSDLEKSYLEHRLEHRGISVLHSEPIKTKSTEKTEKSDFRISVFKDKDIVNCIEADGRLWISTLHPGRKSNVDKEIMRGLIIKIIEYYMEKRVTVSGTVADASMTASSGMKIASSESFIVETAPDNITKATDVSIKVSYDGSSYTVDGSFKVPKETDLSDKTELKWDSLSDVFTDTKKVTALTLKGSYTDGKFTVTGGSYTATDMPKGTVTIPNEYIGKDLKTAAAEASATVNWGTDDSTFDGEGTWTTPASGAITLSDVPTNTESIYVKVELSGGEGEGTYKSDEITIDFAIGDVAIVDSDITFTKQV